MLGKEYINVHLGYGAICTGNLGKPDAPLRPLTPGVSFSEIPLNQGLCSPQFSRRMLVSFFPLNLFTFIMIFVRLKRNHPTFISRLFHIGIIRVIIFSQPGIVLFKNNYIMFLKSIQKSCLFRDKDGKHLTI